MTRRSAPILVVGGLTAAALLAAWDGTPASDIVVLVGLAAAGALTASGGGAVVLRRIRHRPLRDQTLAIAISAIAATVVGVAVSAAGMFISSHDLQAVVVVLVVSAAVAVGAALQLGDDLVAGARDVGELALRLGDGELVEGLTVPPAGELAAVAAQLEQVSRRLHESRERERALEASRRELIAWVSHDLRSPLATIRAMAEAIDDGVVDDPHTTARYHHQIRTDAERLSGLVDDLFELSRINSGALRLHRAPTPLSDVVAHALRSAQEIAALKGVTVEASIDGLPVVAADAQELGRVLHNLLDNAIRHTKPGGRVVVAATCGDGSATLSVLDECGGIPEDDLDRVFDVAFRGDAARSKDERGGGLGLAIARGLVEAQDGQIEVTNEPDGCRFTVQLPVLDIRTG